MGEDSSNSDNTIAGFYLYGDQLVWSRANKSLSLFSQLGFSPSENSKSDYFIGFGTSFCGLFKKDGCDNLGLALGYQNFTGGYKNDTVIEFTYKYPFCKYLYLQPDLQYVIDPSGGYANISNALVTNIRFGLVF